MLKTMLWTKVKSILIDLECPILVFPVLVVMIVAITFLFPYGHCGAWQWWLAVILTIALSFYRAKEWCKGVMVSIAFLLVLVAFWIFGCVILFGGYRDALAYHMPAIRLMTEGWNPVWQSTLESISDFSGFSSDYVNAYHMISMPKVVWYFDAAAYYFFNNPYNLLFPLAPFLLIAVMYVLLDVFRNVGAGARLVVAAIAVWSIPDIIYGVDAVVALSALGLLMLLYDNIRAGRWSWLRLIVFTFWMATAKQTGLLHCCVFWCVFVCVNILKKQWTCAKNAFILGSIVLMLFTVASVSPYLSSYINYGHPLYPKYSFNEERFPTINLTGDFLIRNDDAATMGHLGSYVNAFVSAKVAQYYYQLKTGKEEFKPWVVVWDQIGCGGTGAPTKMWFRVFFLGLVLMLLIYGGIEGRFIAISVILGTLAMPTEMIGYIRYTPWAVGAVIFCVPLFYRTKLCHWFSKFKVPLVILVLTFFLSIPLIHLSYYVDDAYMVSELLEMASPKFIIHADVGPGSRIVDGVASYRAMLGNVILLKKQSSWLVSSEILMPQEDISLDEKTFYRFPSNGFIASVDGNAVPYSEHEKLFHMSREERLMRTPLFVVKTLFVTLPKSIWEVVCG